ncbi:hypothetical protein FOFC_07338 [Fusarium oxysporum]|nr:hypothetical protein FOFC_07338 [Fusarium oxysporum]
MRLVYQIQISPKRISGSAVAESPNQDHNRVESDPKASQMITSEMPLVTKSNHLIRTSAGFTATKHARTSPWNLSSSPSLNKTVILALTLLSIQRKTVPVRKSSQYWP